MPTLNQRPTTPGGPGVCLAQQRGQVVIAEATDLQRVTIEVARDLIQRQCPG